MLKICKTNNQGKVVQYFKENKIIMYVKKYINSFPLTRLDTIKDKNKWILKIKIRKWYFISISVFNLSHIKMFNFFSWNCVLVSFFNHILLIAKAFNEIGLRNFFRNLNNLFPSSWFRRVWDIFFFSISYAVFFWNPSKFIS